MKISSVIQGFWLDRKSSFSLRTIENYERFFRYFVEFVGDVEFSTITATDIRRYLNHLATDRHLSKRTVHDAWIPLSSLWTWAQREFGATHIIRDKVKAPNFPKTSIDPFTQADIAAITDIVDYDRQWSDRPVRSKRVSALRDRCIILTLLDTGIRASELCALVVGDYDQARGRLFIAHGKGGKSRFVFVGDRTRKSLWRYLVSRPDAKQDEPLFATRTGTHLTRNNLHHMLRDLGRKAGIEHVHPHRFRHTFAITFLRNGGNLFELQAILGHESLATVQIYARLAEVDVEQAGRSRSPADKWKL